MANLVINIAQDFSRCPGARFKEEGDFSGEEFRSKFLVPKLREAIEKNVKLVVNLDGAAGYSTAFIEESFGGLVREDGFNIAVLKDKLVIISDEDRSYIDDINLYIKHAWDNR